MSSQGSVVIVGGTRGIGRELVKRYASRGFDVVLTGTNEEVCATCAAEIGPNVRGLAFDLAKPETIEPALKPVESVKYLVLAAIERDSNTIAGFDFAKASNLVNLKLLGYPEVIHCLRPRLTPDASIVLFGGNAKEVPYPGSTIVSSVNGGVVGLTRSLVFELKPIRVNSIHPGVVGDSPYWVGREAALESNIARTPTGRLATMADIVAGVEFLLENGAANGLELILDGGIGAL